MNKKISAYTQNDNEPPARKRLILLADASVKNRNTVTAILEKAGYRVHTAISGEHAIRLMEECPDLILLSEKLPDISGYEVCRIMKANQRCAHVPVILTAPAFGENEDMKERVLCGADAYLTLPIDSLVLLSIIKMTLRAHAEAIESNSILTSVQKAFLEQLSNEQNRFKASEYELAQFIELSPIPMAIYRGQEHVYSLVNGAEHKLMRKDVLGKRAIDAHPTAEKFIAQLDEVYHTGKSYVSKEIHYEIKKETGNPESIWLNEWLYPFRDIAGSIVGILGVGQNVTEQVQGRQEMASILNAIPALVARIDTEQRIVYVNENNESYFDAPENMRGKTLPEYFGENYTSFKDNVDTALRGEAVQFEWTSPTLSDGIIHHFLVNFAPEYTSVGQVKGFVASVFSIDNLKKIEAKLKSAKDEAEVQNTNLEDERDLRERFVATLSHDLRNPLAAARMSAELLARDKEDRGGNEKLLMRIIDCMDEMDNMIRNMLDANLIRAGEKLPIRIKECGINAVVGGALAELTTIHGDRFSFTPIDEIRGYWDGTAIRRVLENLCGNAVKYGSPDHINVSVKLSTDEREVEIAVQNWGPVIPKEELDTIFHYFRRQKRAQTQGYGGWGIGLTIVRGIAEAHGGTAIVESGDECGTIFHVKLLRDARMQLENA